MAFVKKFAVFSFSFESDSAVNTDVCC